MSSLSVGLRSEDLLKSRVLFLGTPDFAVPTLKVLLEMGDVEVVGVVTQPDKEAGRGKQVRPSPIKKLAVENNLRILQPKSIRKNLASFLEELKKLEPIDIGVVVAFGQILPEGFLNFPRCGCLNVHASLLPRWRGAAPIHRALLAGDQKTGVCLIRLVEELDAGPIYSESTVSIRDEDNVGTLHDKLAVIGAELLQETLPGILTGQIAPEEQPEEGVTYARKIEKTEGQIDWQNDAESIARQVRGFSPFPAAFTRLVDKRFKILAASAREDSVSSEQAAPGTILHADKVLCEVKCGTGTLRLERVQLEGKRAMEIEEFLCGANLHVGDRLVDE